MTTKPTTDVEARIRALHDAICPDETDGDGCTDPTCPDLAAVRAAYAMALEDVERMIEDWSPESAAYCIPGIREQSDFILESAVVHALRALAAEVRR